MGGHSLGCSASKAAVVSLTKTVALDVSGANIFVPEKTNVSIRLFPPAGWANQANMPRLAFISLPMRPTAPAKSSARTADLCSNASGIVRK